MADTASVCSLTSSRGSRASTKSSRYRTVATAATVDESLFASKPTQFKKEQPDFIEVLTKDSIRKLRARTNNPRSDNTTSRIILSKADYNRIKKAAHVLSKEDEIAMKNRIKQEKATALEESQQRKERLGKFEKQRQRSVQRSEFGQIKKEENDTLLRKAQEQMDEEEDEIKHLNELILYAKCVAIRDAQVVEKKVIKEERLAEEARLDSLQEKIRQAEVKKFEQREQERHLERCRGAQVIREQIIEREQKREIDQEIRDQETIALLQHLEKVKEDEYITQLKKKEAQLELMKDVEAANNDSIQRKVEEAAKEKLEEQKIVEYIQQKDAAQANLELEAEAKMREREKEIARIRSQQEKAQDHKQAQDLLRAKRAMEDHERQARAKEQAESSEKKHLVDDLNNARDKQIANQLKFTAMQAHRDREEFERQVSIQQKLDSIRAEKLERQAKVRKQHNKDVQAQIEEKRKARFEERRQFFIEGIEEKKQRTERAAKIKAIKERKIAEVSALGVGKKYVGYVESETFSEKVPSISSTAANNIGRS